MTREETAELLGRRRSPVHGRELDALVAADRGLAGRALAGAARGRRRPCACAADRRGPALRRLRRRRGAGRADARRGRAFLRRSSVLDVAVRPRVRRGAGADRLRRRARAARPRERAARAARPRGERYRLHRLLAGRAGRELDARRAGPRERAAPPRERVAAGAPATSTAPSATRSPAATTAMRRALVWGTAARARSRRRRRRRRARPRRGSAERQIRHDARARARRRDARSCSPGGATSSRTGRPPRRGRDAGRRDAGGVRPASPRCAPRSATTGLPRVIEDAALAAGAAPAATASCAALCQPRRRAPRTTCWATARRRRPRSTAGARRAAVDGARAPRALPRAARRPRPRARGLGRGGRAGHARARPDRPPPPRGRPRVRARVRRRPRVVRAHAGRIDEARARPRRRRRACRPRLVDFAPWYEAELRILCVRAAWRLCDVPGRARAPARRRALRAPRRRTRPCWPRGWTQVARPARRRDGGRPRAPPASLTAAELRILRFLPTHLSFREIAERTFVSANTVKTQANAVYRKLDVVVALGGRRPGRAALGVLDPS